jgi:farnesyl-diphosphate farnesyltransferase
MDRCYELLDATSRTFGIAIRSMPDPVRRDTLCLMYIVFRALDTIEDEDCVGDVPHRAEMLASFADRLQRPDLDSINIPCAPSKYADLMRELGSTVVRQLRTLPQHVQTTTLDTVREMAVDMKHFLLAPVNSWDTYRHYCWCVAGRLAGPILAVVADAIDCTAANIECVTAMGNFVQRINVIRDVREDAMCGRCYWPPEAYAQLVDDPMQLLDRSCPRDVRLAAMRAMVSEAVESLHGIAKPDRAESLLWFARIFAGAVCHLPFLYNNEEVFNGRQAIHPGHEFWKCANLPSMQECVDSIRISLQDLAHKSAQCDDPALASGAERACDAITGWLRS